MEEQCVILKTDLLPNFESPNCCGRDPELRVGAGTLILASLKVYYFSVSETDFYVIIFLGAGFLSASHPSPMYHRCIGYFPKLDSLNFSVFSFFPCKNE